MDFFWSLRIDTVEKILETAFVLVIREVYQLLKFFLKSVSKKTIVDSRHARHIYSYDSKMFHLLG